jgi:hypothetical protein
VERVYFEKLLVRGVKPAISIFIDGYNDFHIWRGEPGSTWWIREQFLKWYRGEADMSFGWYMKAAWDWLPAVQLVETLRPKQTLDSFGGPKFDGDSTSLEYFQDPVKIRKVIERFDTNMGMTEAIGDAFGVAVLFVIQPVATYNYDGELPLGPLRGEGMRTRWGYPAMREHLSRHPMRSNVLWCADVQSGIKRNLYVDQAIHYNVEGSGLVARCIAEGLGHLKLLHIAG